MNRPPAGRNESDTPLGPKSPQVLLQQLIGGYTTSQAVYVAAKLGVADLLVDQALTCDELAARTGTDDATLYRFLRALTALTVFVEDDHGRFSLGALGRYLLSDGEGSLRAYAIHANEECYQAWGEALHAVRTGQPGFEKAFGAAFYDYMAAHPDADAVWNEAMDQTERAWTVNPGLVDAYDWHGWHTVVDVGGGHGFLMAAILRAAPWLNGIVFDLPHVVAGASAVLQAQGVADRCQVIGGDAFDSVPAGADLYVLSRVLFNWADDPATAILRHCRQAMAEGGRVLVIEPVITPHPANLSALIDLNVFMVCGGRARTGTELDVLFDRAGLRFSRIIQTPSAWNIIETRAKPASLPQPLPAAFSPGPD